MENFFFRNILRIIAFVYILEKWGKRQKVCGKTGSIFNPENYTPCSSQTNQEFLKVPCFHSRQDYELFCSSSLKYNTWIGQGKGKSQNGKVSKLSRLEARFSKASETFRANIKKPPLVHLYLKTPETSCMKQMKGTSFILKNVWINQLCNRRARDFAMALRIRKVSRAFEKRAPAGVAIRRSRVQGFHPAITGSICFWVVSSLNPRSCFVNT